MKTLGLTPTLILFPDSLLLLMLAMPGYYGPHLGDYTMVMRVGYFPAR
jgi:hypothetical protein